MPDGGSKPQKTKVSANRKKEANKEGMFGGAVLAILVIIIVALVVMSNQEEKLVLDKDFVDYQIDFVDKDFEAGILAIVNKTKKEPVSSVMASDALRIKELYIIGDFLFDNVNPYKPKGQYEIEYHGDESGFVVDEVKYDGRCPVKSIEDIVHFKNLQHFQLNFGYIDDLSPVAELEKVEELWLNNNQINDITPLIGNTVITKLNLGNNRIEEIHILTHFTQLTYLSLYSNKITDGSPLANIYPTIDYINLAANPIKDWKAITG